MTTDPRKKEVDMSPAYTMGIIRVITQEQAQVDAHGQLIEQWIPGVKTLSRCIPDQPEGVHDARTKRAAAPGFSKRAQPCASRLSAQARAPLPPPRASTDRSAFWASRPKLRQRSTASWDRSCWQTSYPPE